MSLDTPEINRLYSCSQWAGRDPEQVLTEFLSSQQLAYDTLKTLETEFICEDIPYGEDDSQMVDVWGKVHDHMFIMIHGGYWQEGDRKYILSPAVSLVGQGIPVASVGYCVATAERPLSYVIQDVVAGVKLLLDRYPHVTSFTLAGHSAGAHLAFKACAILRNPRITKLVLLASVYWLEELVTCEIGRGIGLTTKEATDCSCSSTELLNSNIDVLLLIGDKDAPRLKEQNERMATELRKDSKRVKYQVLPDTDHFSLISGFGDINSPQTKILLDFEKEERI